MTPAIKKFTLLAAKSGLSQDEFNRYWLHVHGPLATRQPEFWKYTTRYVQNHVIRRVDANAGGDFAGVVQTWQRPRDDMSRGFVDEPRYFELIRPDEEKFLDVTACSILFTEERVIQDGPKTNAKLLCFVRDPQPDWPSHATGFLAGVRRQVENQVLKGLSRGLGAGAASLDFSACIELWFDSGEDVDRALEAEDRPAWARPGSSSLIYVVEEHDVGPPAEAD